MRFCKIVKTLESLMLKMESCYLFYHYYVEFCRLVQCTMNQRRKVIIVIKKITYK